MSSENLKVGVITSSDPNDKRSWSGTYYRMNRALKKEFSTVVSLGPVKLDRLDYSMRIQLRICQIFHKIFFKKNYNTNYSHIKSRFHSNFFDKQIKKNNIDVLFAPSACVQIAHLKTNIPVCYYCDTTFSLMVNYYNSYESFSKKSMKISHEIEQMAINKSKTHVFSSQWAFDSAKIDYNSKDTFLVKMGANIDNDPTEEDLLKEYGSTINILFVGVDWKRKGGDIVLETIDKLDKKGYNVNLTVVGCIPPQEHPKMKVIPFLDKNNKKDGLEFHELLKKSHLFFMPTRADCFGIVFCEANAYGLPVITTNTGGVSSVIENGVNGYMLSMSAKSQDYFEVIADLISNKEKLNRIAKTSRSKYLKELNWDQWGKEMKKILSQTHSMSDK